MTGTPSATTATPVDLDQPTPDPSPKRIQRKRSAGWRMPEGAIYVGRPTVWGNPYRPGDPDPRYVEAGWTDVLMNRAAAVWLYRSRRLDELDLDYLDRTLRGHDLVCWCPLTDARGHRVPCHADVLLEIANA